MGKALYWRGRLVLYKQLLTLLRGRLLRWRLETFGLYMPSLPQARPWWRVNGHALLLLFRQRRAYERWLRELDAVRVGGSSAWWRQRLGGGYSSLQGYVDDQNRAEPANAMSHDGACG